MLHDGVSSITNFNDHCSLNRSCFTQTRYIYYFQVAYVSLLCLDTCRLRKFFVFTLPKSHFHDHAKDFKSRENMRIMMNENNSRFHEAKKPKSRNHANRWGPLYSYLDNEGLPLGL